MWQNISTSTPPSFLSLVLLLAGNWTLVKLAKGVDYHLKFLIYVENMARQRFIHLVGISSISSL